MNHQQSKPLTRLMYVPYRARWYALIGYFEHKINVPLEITQYTTINMYKHYKMQCQLVRIFNTYISKFKVFLRIPFFFKKRRKVCDQLSRRRRSCWYYHWCITILEKYCFCIRYQQQIQIPKYINRKFTAHGHRKATYLSIWFSRHMKNAVSNTCSHLSRLTWTVVCVCILKTL